MTAARVGSIAAAIAGTIVVYLILNVVLVGGQKLWHSKDQERLDAVMAILNRESPIIDSAQADLAIRLEDLNQSSAAIDQAKAALEALDRRYPNGMPNSVVARYNADVARLDPKVAEHNEHVAVYESMRVALENRIDEYNELVQEANALIEKIGPTWYVVPVPRSAARARP
jgi:chromosome segregation ATPase